MTGPHLLPFENLPLPTAYAIFALRAEVFVVEQDCPYQDLDGKDVDCLHLWYAEGEHVVAYARLLPPGLAYPEAGIGRVVTSWSRRRSGLGKALMAESIRCAQATWPGHDIVIMAQSYLLDFYTAFQFVVEREAFLEDGIPHRWMRRSSSKILSRRS